MKPTECSPNRYSLKAYFCGCALIGRIAGEEDATFNTSISKIVKDAYDLGELMFEKYGRGKPFCDPQIQQENWFMRYEITGATVCLQLSAEEIAQVIEALEIIEPEGELLAAFKAFRKEEFA